MSIIKYKNLLKLKDNKFLQAVAFRKTFEKVQIENEKLESTSRK